MPRGHEQSRGLRRINVLGLPMDVGPMPDAVSRLVRMASGPGTQCATYLNPWCVNLAFSDIELRRAYGNFELVLADGIGVVWAAERRGENVPERCAVTDLFPMFLEQCQRAGIRLFFLGAGPGVGEAMAHKLQEKYPGLIVAGWHHGFFPRADEPEVMEAIRSSAPDAVLVAMGVPAQERWVMAHRGEIKAGLIWCVGGLFDFYSQNIPRAPGWMIRWNLEWLFRLIQEPRRMWRRYLIGNARFILRVLFNRSTQPES